MRMKCEKWTFKMKDDFFKFSSGIIIKVKQNIYKRYIF